MSRQNVEVVRRAFEYKLGRVERAEAASAFDPEFVANPVEEGPSHGPEAARGVFDRWKNAWEEFEVTAEEFLDAGDRVLVTVYCRGRGRGSGVEVEARFYEVYALRKGRVVRSDEYTGRAAALEAAGLSG